MKTENSITSLGVFVRRYTRDLYRLGIRTIGEALLYFPFRYEDFSAMKTVADAKVGEQVTLQGMIKKIEGFRSLKRNLLIIEAQLADETGSMSLVWFGQKHLLTAIKVGDVLMVSGVVSSGKHGKQIVSSQWEPLRDVQVHVGRIAPVYSVTGNLTPKAIRTVMMNVVACAKEMENVLPDFLIEKHLLVSRSEMIQTLHFPENMAALKKAEDTRDFEQVFSLALGNAWYRKQLSAYQAAVIPFFEKETKEFLATLPFELTPSQKRAAWEIMQDLQKPTPMNRLLDGDVGAGKTLVAALAMLQTSLAGKQSVLLSPTTVLARQHFQSLQNYFAKQDIKIALVVSGEASVCCLGKILDVSDVREQISSGDISFIIGTHALLEDKVTFSSLTLVVVDEQHRFGVAQRKKLSEKAPKGYLPHLLSMTATPIPRTLALTMCGDLDISLIPQKPKGRVPIETVLVTKDRSETLQKILSDVAKAGDQAFLVCPRIVEDDVSDKRSVEALYKEVQQLCPNVRTIVLHGKMKPEEKERVMRQFVGGLFDVLIATTVIEVGVDVPNATVMIVDGAESFGLAQLHQLRGRVGRGSKPGRCYLFPHHASQEAFQRLQMLTVSHDGWQLAEADLETRGPGELMGVQQTGFSFVSMSALKRPGFYEMVKKEAEEIIEKDVTLAEYPTLKKMVEERFADVNFS